MDVTRDTFDATKGFRKVIFQKGRPPFDAEVNELQDNVLHHAKAPAAQWLTRNAANGMGKGYRPKEAPSGSTVNDFAIEKGVIWRNGEFYELANDILYSDQVDENGLSLPALAPPGAGTRADVVYLDVYEAEISGAQDPDIVDPTYGVETSRRMKKMALVKVHNLASVSHGATPSAYLPSPPAGHLYFVLAVMVRTTSTSITNSMLTQWGLELWVAEAGDDSNNGLRQTSALRSIQEAINRVPMFLYEDVRILVLANSLATSTDAGTGDSYWQEDLRIENVFGQPRDYVYDAVNGRGDTLQTEADGVQSPVYRLIISSYTFNDPALSSTSFFYLDGGITVRNCNGVKLCGIYQRSSPTHGYLVDNSVNVSIIQAVSESCGGDGFRFIQSSVDVFLSAAFASAGVGMKATQSTVQLMDTFWVEACPIGIQATHGANILIMNAPAEYSGAFYAGVDYRQILNCTTGISAVDGGKVETYFPTAPATGERVKIGGGATTSIGVHARFGGQVELSYTDIGNISGYLGPQVAGAQADNNGVLRLNQVAISGRSGITGNQIATFTGLFITEKGELIVYDGVTCLNYTLAGLRLHDNSTAIIAPNGTGTALTIGFDGNRGSANHPVVVNLGSTLQVVGGAGVNQASLQIDGYHGTYAGTKPLAAFAIRSCSAVRVSSGGGSTSAVVVNNVNGNLAGMAARECVADLRMNSVYLGNSNTKLDTAGGSAPVKSGAGSANYSVENVERVSNGVGAGLTLTGHNDVVSNSDDGGTL